MKLQFEQNIIVKDSCIIIDLLELNLINEFLNLGFYVTTTQNVVDEIVEERQCEALIDLISNEKMIVDNNFDLEVVIGIMQETESLSFTDATVMELSLRVGGILITSDNALRKHNLKKNRETHGIIWIIEKLCDDNIICNDTGIKKLKELMKINQRIPLKICKNLLLKLEERRKTYNNN